MEILFSVDQAQTVRPPRGEIQGPSARHRVSVEVRPYDGGLKGRAKQAFHIREALRILRAARSFDALALCTVGIEAFFVARFRAAVCPQVRVVCFDLLLPRESAPVRFVGPYLRALDGFACIRRGDIETLKRRFGVPREKCAFVPFPVGDEVFNLPTSTGDYIYSAGSAHRDWPTLLSALQQVPQRAILAPGSAPEGTQHQPLGRVEIVPPQTPAQGRALMAASAMVALSLFDTKLPSGPLVLLDALGAGKAVVCSDVNGTRDYVKPGETALVVPPADSDALARAIMRLMRDPLLRAQLGQAAQADARARFTPQLFMQGVLGLVERAAPRNLETHHEPTQ